MQLVVVRDRLAGIEVEPSLPALLRRACVPRDAERLESSSRQGDQVLLQRLDAERVGHLELGRLSVGTVGADQEASVAPEELRGHPEVGVACAIEIAEHRRLVDLLHGQIVV